MKKFIILFVVAFSSFVINANAACPLGWTSSDFSYQYDSDNDNIPDCLITVYYCSIILPTGEYKVQVDAVRLDMPCGISLLGNSNFWGDLESRLIKDIEINGTFYPCPLTVYNIQVWRAKCWKIQNDPNHEQVLVLNCGYLAYCEKRYTICYDVNQGKNVITLVEANSIGTPDCSGEMPMLPPLLKTWDDEWTTECYGISCN